MGTNFMPTSERRVVGVMAAASYTGSSSSLIRKLLKELDAIRKTGSTTCTRPHGTYSRFERARPGPVPGFSSVVATPTYWNVRKQKRLAKHSIYRVHGTIKCRRWTCQLAPLLAARFRAYNTARFRAYIILYIRVCSARAQICFRRHITD